MVVTHEVTEDQAAALFADPSSRSIPPGEGRIEGPGCLTCKQGYAMVKDLPCPGRVWPDDEMPKHRAKAQLPRKERRSLDAQERRAARKSRSR